MKTSEEAKYPLTEREKAELQKRFTYHPPKDDQPARYVAFRDKALELAVFGLENIPDSRERNVFLTELETAVMWGNAGIARNE